MRDGGLRLQWIRAQLSRYQTARVRERQMRQVHSENHVLRMGWAEAPS